MPRCQKISSASSRVTRSSGSTCRPGAQSHGWDKNGSVADMQINFDPDGLELTINSSQPLPKVKVFDHIDSDMLGNVARDTRVPGPLADPIAEHTWRIDPRTVV